MIELVEFDGVRYAEIIRASARVRESTFFSPPESSFQFGLLAHGAGYREPLHVHRSSPRTIADVQQMFVVQRGVVAVDFFSEKGERVTEVVLHSGDAIVLIHGAHLIRVIEDMQCITVKQGPFLGNEEDKIAVNTK